MLPRCRLQQNHTVDSPFPGAAQVAALPELLRAALVHLHVTRMIWKVIFSRQDVAPAAALETKRSAVGEVGRASQST